ncbi:apoptosis regulatory protein Siva isoform X2 [Callorhinchus milii]|uniref:apoptosis regulatory protein Siva isoform X2 n=1 Tax=Callorhinchus milii TaxID=7868 RepID=UPI000457467A|nr:apoptosis regulatory protein Siva isoform X2 [Callorhinchus milii]|eukprot:gi/632942479/ref/XP_007886436.1/ PREDICTED: apoptosis regulatory protein Siva isoform X2 [Callorhinchus milii]
MKRTNPFGDAAPLQRKVRVTQKEINEGVFGEKYKREVYEKTKKLLFNGAQAFMGDMWNGNSEENCTVVHLRSPSEAPSPQSGPGDVCNGYERCDLLRGQTFLGSDGRLMKASLPLPRSPNKQTATNCFSCLKFSNITQQCSQCDRLMCQHCSKVCDSCMRMCCSVCSVADYNESYDKVICYDCVSYRG